MATCTHDPPRRAQLRAPGRARGPQAPPTPSHLDDSPAEASHVRQLLQRLSVGVVVLRELRLHNLRGGEGGDAPARGDSETPAQSAAPARRPRPRQLRPLPATRVRAEGWSQETFSAPPTFGPAPAPATRGLPRYLQLFCGEGRPRALGRLGLTVLFRGHCPLQREAVPWGR